MFSELALVPAQTTGHVVQTHIGPLGKKIPHLVVEDLDVRVLEGQLELLDRVSPPEDGLQGNQVCRYPCQAVVTARPPS